MKLQREFSLQWRVGVVRLLAVSCLQSCNVQPVSNLASRYDVFSYGSSSKYNVAIALALFREASSATSSVSRLIGICIRLARYTLCATLLGYMYLDFFKVSYDYSLARLFTSWQRQTVRPSLQRRGEAW